MKINILMLSCILILSIHAASQETSIFEFINFQKAIENGTRTRHGLPGVNYWINRARYKLEATIDTSSNVLYGKGEIIYFNQSPDTLNRIVLRLYQNKNKIGNKSRTFINAADVHDGTYIESLSIDHENYIEGNEYLKKDSIYLHQTIMELRLQDPLFPQDSLIIEISWNFPIPIYPTRYGSYQKNYFIGYWYPEIPVYDDINGWDLFEHGGILEFYNDFNDYDVTIHVPRDYIVWGTGTCTNEKEVFTSRIYERILKARSVYSGTGIISPGDYETDIVQGDTWKFSTAHVPDFAFAAVRGFIWEGQLVQAGDRKVFVDIVAPADTAQYSFSLAAAVKAIDFFSNEYPAIPYPYEHATVFFNGNIGRGSMEYPMICNNSTYSDSISHRAVIAHELSHNYMPFYLGFNESNYAWMDEGCAVFFDFKYSGLVSNRPQIARYRYENWAGKIYDYPLMTSSVSIWGQNNNWQNYMKPFTNLVLLEDLLGEELFIKAIQEFARYWNGKHPTPYDFFYTFNRIAGEDLSWFWNPFYFEFGYADLAIKSVADNRITVAKIGTNPIPIKLKITFTDQSEQSITRNCRIWMDDKREYSIDLETQKEIMSVELDDHLIPDLDKSNNTYINHKWPNERR